MLASAALTFVLFCSGTLVVQSRAPLLNLRRASGLKLADSPKWKASPLADVQQAPCPIFPCKEEAPELCPLGSHKGTYKDGNGCACPCCLHNEDRPPRCLTRDENLYTPLGKKMLDGAAETMRLAPDEQTKASAVLRTASDFRTIMAGKMRNNPFDFPDRAGVLPMNADDHAEHSQAQVHHAAADTKEFKRVLKSAGFPAVPLAVKQHGEV